MKILLIFVLGFISHKAVNYVYDYSFEKSFMSSTCSDQYVKDSNDPKVDAPLTKRFECTYQAMGFIEKLKYVLVRPSPLHNNDWTF